MKSYTDINQSRKLAEILPLESADMCINSTNPYMIFTEVRPLEGFDEEHDPAWSLAALLSVIRKTIGYTLYGLNNVYISCKLSDFRKIETEVYDNEVDACVAMIEKLHELKML